MAGCLHVALPASGIGGEVRHEGERGGVELEMHAGVVDEGCFVEVDIEAVIGAHLQGGLHAGLRERCLRGVGGDGLGHESLNLGEARLHVVVLLGVIVAGYPEGHVVACEGKLGELFLDDEVGEAALLGELIAEAEAVVVEAEADVHEVAGALLFHTYEEFVVVVADGRLLAPYGVPGLIK